MKQVETTREAMINRRSVRKYKTDMIPRDIIERIVEAGTYAANGRGHQASIILAVTNKELRDKLSEMKVALAALKDILAKASAIKDNKEKAFAYLHEVCPAMAALRKPADELEMLVDKELWPFPSYGDLVFEV